MAIVVPILSEFSDRGIRQANKSFEDLEGFGAKASHAIRKAAVPATAAIAGLAAATFDAVNAAIEDQQAQARLVRTLQATTGATDKQIEAIDEYITKAGRAFGVTDDRLRPALEKLANRWKKWQVLWDVPITASTQPWQNSIHRSGIWSSLVVQQMKSLAVLMTSLVGRHKPTPKPQQASSKSFKHAWMN